MQTQSNSSVKGKADFGRIYNAADPRAYFQTLRPYSYLAPEFARPIFLRAFDALSQLRGRAVRVLDLCCGYGINAAILRYRLTMQELYARYDSVWSEELSTDALAERDRRFFRQLSPRPNAPESVTGIDVAANAVDYAERVGLLDHGAGINLEKADPDEALARKISEADIVTVTGGIGYITDRTFRRILDLAPKSKPPWVAWLPLRATPTDRLDPTFEEFGLRTERWTRDTIPQRRFVSRAERAGTLEGLENLGLSPEGREDDGYLHAELRFTRPEADIARIPLAEIVRAP